MEECQFSEMNRSQLFELILNTLYSGIIVVDKECKIVFINRIYEDLLKVKSSEAVGRLIFDFFPNSRLPQVIKQGESELGQKCRLKGDIPYLVNRIPVKEGGRVIGVVLQSIYKDLANFKELAARMDQLESKVKFYKNGLSNLLAAKYSFDEIKGETESICRAKAIAAKYALTESPVLIRGATGTGKELFAHAIHLASERAGGPLVCVNCAAIPKELFESELFGYVPGAFTGASQKGKIGKLELAHGGSLFLDEIGDLPLDAQVKLLRGLENKTIEKLGSPEPIKMDFRLIAATNRDLKGMIKHGQFREELFYRLNAMTVYIPKLSERKEDIPVLVAHYLKILGKPDILCTNNAMDTLKRYPWPGNARELRNVIEHTVSLLDGNVIDVKDLPPEIVLLHYNIQIPRDRSDKSLAGMLAQCESQLIKESLRVNKGNMVKTARHLGISRTALYRKCKKHNLNEYEWLENCNC